MSTRIVLGPEADLPPVSRADLVAYFHAAAKPRDQWRVGAEFEKIGVDRATGRQLDYDSPGGIRDLFAQLTHRLYGWQPYYERGNVIALLRDGATITLEPGGQVELSTAPFRRLADIDAQLALHLEHLGLVAEPGRVAWIAAGFTPFSPVAEIALVPRHRYKLMAKYLPATSAMGLAMMKATASVQVCLDYGDEADAVRKFTTAITLGPLVNCLFANAALAEGRPTGDLSYRARVWQGMDPRRSGLLTELFAGGGFSFARWVDYLLQVPMMFYCPRGRFMPAEGRTFADFMARGLDGYFPTIDDWETHLTSVFPEVRLKRFLEIRGADAVRPPLAVAVPALWKGLLYDPASLDAAHDLAQRIPPADRAELFRLAYREGLAGKYQGRPIRAWCRTLADLAADGLRRQAEASGEPDERSFLDPVFQVLDRGRSPGAELLAGWEVGRGDHAAILGQLEYEVRHPHFVI